MLDKREKGETIPNGKREEKVGSLMGKMPRAMLKSAIICEKLD